MQLVVSSLYIDLVSLLKQDVIVKLFVIKGFCVWVCLGLYRFVSVCSGLFRCVQVLFRWRWG